MPPKLTTEADIRIGARVRFFREKARLSQTELATAVGVSFQQIQKNELGKNRIAASRLQEIAICLGVTVADLYDEPAPAPVPQRKPTSAETRVALEAAALAHAEALEREALPSWMSEAA